MNDADLVAERYQTLEGYKLADYRIVALPYYVIYVNAVILERRPLMAVTEFTLKAIAAGITAGDDVRRFLGLDERFFSKLVGQLVEERYLSMAEGGTLQLLSKGEQILHNSYEAVPQEREVPIIWDLLRRRPAGYLEMLIKESDAKREGMLLIRARPMKVPHFSDIPLHEVQEGWAMRRQGPAADEHTEILKLRDTKRKLLRYRPAVGLVYTKEKQHDVRVRFIVNGRVDEDASQGFAEQDGPRHMGIAAEFVKTATSLAIRTRLKGLPGEMTPVGEYGNLLRRRAVARFGLDGLRRRLEEEEEQTEAHELSRRITEKEAELVAVEAQIAALPMRELMPYEVIQLTRQAMRGAKKRVILTTRMPSRERLTIDLVNDIKMAASRGVRISIYLAGKIPTDTAGARWSAARELDRVVNAVGGVDVAFLSEVKRSTFEVVADDNMLLLCNRPPLGDASNIGAGFHPFTGVLVSDVLAVRAYVAAHLSPENLQVARRLSARVDSQRKSGRQKAHPRQVAPHAYRHTKR